jgi:hypothetical protein
MIFRIYHETLGGHVHMRVFAGKAEGALGKCGDLTMRVDEFEVFRNCSLIDFRPENNKRGGVEIKTDEPIRQKSLDETLGSFLHLR